MATDVANNPTRQQLDELDSLLQKMLAVPGTSHDESRRPAEKPKKPAAAPAAAPITAKVSAPTYTTEPTPAPAPPTKSNDNWAIDLNPRGSSSVLGDRSPLVSGSPPVAEPVRQDTPGPAALLQVQTLMQPPATPQPRRRRQARVSLLMRPFASVSEQFDETVAIFGPLGRLISGSFGRFVMGMTGLVLLCGSGAYAAMLWFGWSR